MRKTWRRRLPQPCSPALAGVAPSASSSPRRAQRYIVVLAGVQGDEGFTGTGTQAAALAAVAAAGGPVANDLSQADRRARGRVEPQRRSPHALASSPLVETVGQDTALKGLPDGGPEQTADPLESLQWDMAHDPARRRRTTSRPARAGRRRRPRQRHRRTPPGLRPRRQAARTSTAPAVTTRSASCRVGPASGTRIRASDNQFHGTHVAGTIAAQANGIGVVGVAPNVTLVPVKVCDATGYCYASAVVDGLTYAGDIKLDVINMSFFVDDDAFQESTEFKCNVRPDAAGVPQSVERAIRYAIGTRRRAGRGARQLRRGSRQPVRGRWRTTATSSRRRRRA